MRQNKEELIKELSRKEGVIAILEDANRVLQMKVVKLEARLAMVLQLLTPEKEDTNG
jgi:hypothetical protein